jgi:hypothetical protein
VKTHQELRDLTQELMDEGTNASVIRTALYKLVPEFPRAVINDLVREEKLRWLMAAELRMQSYAQDKSWQRLERLLATYNRVFL